MLKSISVRRLIDIGMELDQLETTYYMASVEDGPSEPGAGKLTKEELSQVAEHIGRLHDLCEELELHTSAQLLRWHEGESVPSTHDGFTMLRDTIMAELRGRTLFFIPTVRASFYGWDQIVSETVKFAFPQSCCRDPVGRKLLRFGRTHRIYLSLYARS